MSRRDIRYTIRFSEKEWEILEEKIKKEDAWKFKYGTKEGSVNVSAFIREKLFREEIKELAYYRELKNLTYQIRKIGVNINQVAAKINSGHGNIDSVFYLQKNLLQVEEEVKNLIEILIFLKLHTLRHFQGKTFPRKFRFLQRVQHFLCNHLIP